MTNKRFDGPSEVPAGAGGVLFEEQELRGRTDFQSRAPRSGADFKEMGIRRLREAGATISRMGFEIGGFPVDAEVHGENGRRFLVLARGTPDEGPQSGIRRTDTIEKVGFRAIQLARLQELPILIVTSDLPPRSSKPGIYLASLSGDVLDVVSYRGDLRGFQRLQRHFSGPIDAAAPDAPWRALETAPQDSLFDVQDDGEEEPVQQTDDSAAAVNDEAGRRAARPAGDE
jgi:hypothetical protein